MGVKSPPQLWGEYLGARAAGAVVSSIPPDVASAATPWLGSLIHRLDKRHRQRTETHLRHAFPQWSEARVQATTLASFEHLAQLALELLTTPRLINAESWPRRIALDEVQPLVQAVSAPEPVILVTGHIGNWELLGSLLTVIGYPLDAIARRLDNRLLHDWVLGLRERQGLRIIDKRDAAGPMTAVMERGGALGFIADQNGGDRGVFVPFMGRLASTHKSVALLALSYHARIIVGYGHRLPPSPNLGPDQMPAMGTALHYEAGIVDDFGPDDWADQDDPVFYISCRYNRALEQAVRRRPEQYLWMHRRWKSRPRHERQGKPAPASLRRKLEALGWYSDQEIERMLSPQPTGS